MDVKFYNWNKEGTIYYQEDTKTVETPLYECLGDRYSLEIGI